MEAVAVKAAKEEEEFRKEAEKKKWKQEASGLDKLRAM